MEHKRIAMTNRLLKSNSKGKTAILVIAAALFGAMFIPSNLIAQSNHRDPYVPSDKKLDPTWVQSLFEKGVRKVYQGNELNYIAMPCGGIGAGEVEITGNGTLCFTESVYNQMQPANGGLGDYDGAQYLRPQVPKTKIENGFAIRIKEPGQEPQVLQLSRKDFDSLRFIGEYPIATLDFRKSGSKLPVIITSEIFSPFVPLSIRSSANPATVYRFSITNRSSKSVEIELAGWLQNGSFPQQERNKVNKVMHSSGITGILLGADDITNDIDFTDTIRSGTKQRGNGNAQFGNLSIAVLDEHAKTFVSWNSMEDCLSSFKGIKSKDPLIKRFPANENGGGGISSGLKLAPGEKKNLTFMVSWYFPNLYETAPGCPGLVGHIYNNWYKNSFSAATYIADNFNTLYRDTKLFHDTYFDNTLPYWLANRITMPVSTLASGNVAIWENGRMYCYEGVGFCFGTCGHVLNFVTSISKLFPELERSVRLMQDLNDKSGFSPSGRINFRGHNGADPEADHSYASDAQSGYVLKLYREHLNSPDYTFLDSIWPKVKLIIGYHIFRDGADIGIEPNGVLEGLQTFWDPMWYGPNPYNNTLYLAALLAAEEMARIKNENKLADRYHALFEKGKSFMNERMWNGEYYVHLYPSGFKKADMQNGFVKLIESEQNARRYIEAFNNGEPNYFESTACDANQLFGQNWATQLGLGYILPRERCCSAAKSIFLYNWTPDISTVYDAEKPLNRTLAAPGEGAMINGSWPKEKPRSFENTHDKSDIWCGLEYEAACDMINEGLTKEGFIMIRAVHDRYNGIKRNPWNEIEGSDHYSRAMHSWNILLSLSGFVYDGPAGKIGFAPRLTPDNFKCFFSTAEGWGNFSQKLINESQQEIIAVKWGRLNLNKLNFTVTENLMVQNITVKLDGKLLTSTHQIRNKELSVLLDSPVKVMAGQQLEIMIK